MNPDFARSVQDYFHSVYGNTTLELGIFLVIASGYFLHRHYRATRDIRRARTRIPLVVGGWGTRGKSGTERLKAALFNALGYSVFSKTSGTEAMFLVAPRHGPLLEMSLFRPYDKATIWEQANVIKIAADLGTDVFLWECMALTPDYVRVLQRDWMRDDLSTITNTYPDHEDLQGPAGIDIPQVMTRFIPMKSQLATSEEYMVPILRAAARDRETTIAEVGWLEAGLLPDDILARFPYEEHPYNIALVLAIARKYGIRSDFALKEMADRVVPDLGVLKVFEPAPIRQRKLQFVNGMAANERFGFLANWRRTGFATHDPDSEPGTWIATVVNNREDRIPRSRVFAEILVRDAEADRHFLIGTNLNGFLSYLEDAWEDYASDVSLWPGDSSDPGAELDKIAHRARVPRDTSALARRAHAMLSGIGLEADLSKVEAAIEAGLETTTLLDDAETSTAEDILNHVSLQTSQLRELEQIRARLARSGGERDPDVDEQLRQVLRRWFFSKLVVIEDAHATGDEIIERITKELPPGIDTRIMGCQNIKGAGLDFAYRWQAWDTCFTACRDLVSGEPSQVEWGFRTLAQLPRFGVVCHEHLRTTLQQLRSEDAVQSAALQTRFREIEARLEDEVESPTREAERASGKTGNRFKAGLLQFLEDLLDAGDAIKRRRQADRIYRDLVAQRVSSRQAVSMLQALSKRQKGGWIKEWGMGSGSHDTSEGEIDQSSDGSSAEKNA